MHLYLGVHRGRRLEKLSVLERAGLAAMRHAAAFQR